MGNWTKEREAEIRWRCEVATKGPWKVGHGDELLDSDGRNLLYDDDFCCITRTDDANFIAHARTDLPDALERIAELDAVIEKHRKEVTNDACGYALDRLWRDVILARNPNYGDWEYPGSAYRHLKAEFEDALKSVHTLRALLERIYPYFEAVNHVHLPGGNILYASSLWDALKATEKFDYETQ